MDKYIQSLPKSPQNPDALYGMAKRWYFKNHEFNEEEYRKFIRKLLARLGL